MNSYIDFQAIASEYLATNQQSNFYFLIDHAGMPGLHRKLVQSKAEWASLFEDSKERNALQAAPILVLGAANGEVRMRRRLFDWIGINGTYTSTVVALASLLSLQQLMERLAARLNINLSEQMQAMFRFFDPRVFEELTKILSPEQAKTFFSPAEHWWYVDRTGKLVSVQTAFNVDEPLVPPMALNGRQEFALIDASEPDQVLALLRENVPGLMSRLALPNQHTIIARNLSSAREIGIDSISDHVLYIIVALMKGEEFFRTSSWACLWSDARAKGASFSEAIAAINIDENEEAI